MEQYIIIIALIAIIVLSFIIFINDKKNKEQNKKNTTILIEQLSSINNNLNEKIHQQQRMIDEKDALLKETFEMKFSRLSGTLDSKLTNQNLQMTDNIKTVLEKIARLDSAQGQILSLEKSLGNLERVLVDKKTRGMYGEIQLETIFEVIFGSKNDTMFARQYTLSNKRQVDFVIFAPKPLNLIAIDSKFPLENYEKLHTKNITDEEKKRYSQEFKQNLKKHIDDIATKYIIKDETADQAIMFIPSEAIFAYINMHCSDIVEYSYKKKVSLTSPTTLVAVLNSFQILLRDAKRSEYALQLQGHLIKLSEEFDRYQKRWETFNKTIDKVSREAKEISVTSEKIDKAFKKISEVQFNES